MGKGALPLLVALLRTGTEEGKANAACVIAWLAEEVPTRTRIVEAGALPLLVALRRAGTEEGKTNAADAIYWLANDEPTRALIVEAGALLPLIALLHTGTEEGKANAASVIAWLAEEVPTRMRIMEAGALPLLIALLRTGTELGKANAAGAIGSLAHNAPTRALIVEAGALSLLVALLRAGTEEGKASAAEAIGMLAHDATTRALIMEAGALPLLVALLRTGTDDGKTNAADAISWLANDESACALIVEAGALPPLIALVSPSRACSSAKAGKNACCILECLAEDALSRELAEEHGAAGALAAAAHAPDCEWADNANDALRALCPTHEDAERALGGTHLKSCALVAERDLEICGLCAECDTLTEGYASLASLAGPVEKGHDVVFECEHGDTIGGSWLLLAHASPYYEALFSSGSVVSGSGVVKPDPDFSSAAHRALLGQLHALGHAPLPASLDVRLELLYFAANVRGVPDGEGGGPDAVARVLERCGRAVRDSLCADNCLSVLLQLKPCTADVPGLVDAAHAVVVENVVAVLEQPDWLQFLEEFPRPASRILQGIALKQASLRLAAERAPEPDSTRKRPRAA